MIEDGATGVVEVYFDTKQTVHLTADEWAAIGGHATRTGEEVEAIVMQRYSTITPIDVKVEFNGQAPFPGDVACMMRSIPEVKIIRPPGA